MPEQTMTDERLKKIEELYADGPYWSDPNVVAVVAALRAERERNKRLMELLRKARPYLPTDEAYLTACGTCENCGMATPYAAMEMCGKCVVEAIDAALRGETP